MAFNLSTCPTGYITADGTSGTPDLRGEFIRGLDNGRGIDTGRTLGSWQVDMFKSHFHTGAYGLKVGGTVPWYNWANPGNTNYSWSNSNDSTGGAETRPRNIALLYCIKN